MGAERGKNKEPTNKLLGETIKRSPYRMLLE